MLKHKPYEILRRVEAEGFESVWQKSAEILPKPTKRLELTLGKGRFSHPLFDVIQKMRQSFLEIGFTEVSNPIIVDENEVYKQYGPEAPIILDRCYYLATLPRPDIGLSKAKSQEIEKLGVRLTEDKISALQGVLRSYKKGEIASDDLIEKIVDSLEVSDTTATIIISKVFPEFSSLKPEPSTLTLRSHITTAWFLTLQALQHRLELPLKLFSVDIRFRREQREDQTHLRVHHAASCIVMDEEVDVKDGKEITKAILTPLGFGEFRFVQKKVTSKYYTPGMEYEGYIYNSNTNQWIEIVDYGLYSPIALARYDLEYPVLNVGIGVERVALMLYGEYDIRRLVYPQFYTEWAFSDIEIAKMIKFEMEPKSKEGVQIKESIISKALEYADASSPCEFLVYEGKMLGKRVKVYLYEKDIGAKLLGAAAKNQIYVYDGNILGIPPHGMDEVTIINETRKKGVKTGLTYIDSLGALAAAKIEEAVKVGQNKVDIRIRIAKHPSDVNMKISEVARRYITSQNKKIEILGPVFVGIRAEILD